jgi:hypothetical protein
VSGIASAEVQPTCEQKTTGYQHMYKRTLVAIFCLLVLGVLLLFVACGNGYNSPGSPPNDTPQTTPTKGGYSMIYLLDHEIQVLLAYEARCP